MNPGLTEDEDLPEVPAVEFGGTPQARINYLSVSQLKTAAPWVEGGCKRKWWFKKVGGLSEPERASLELGKQVHAQLEHYMRTGEDVLGDIARSALPYLPPPKSAIGCEVSITESNNPITGAKLTADGIPLVGFIDRVDQAGESGRVVSVVDYKTSKDPEKWAASARDLETTKTAAGIQMVGYAVAISEELPEVEIVGEEHLYLHTKPTKADKEAKRDAKRVRGAITPANAREEWKRCDALAKELREVAKAAKPEQVEPCWNSCEAFGGCPFYGPCLVAEARKSQPQEKRMSLKDLLAKRAQGPVVEAPPVGEVQTVAPPDPLPAVLPPDAPKSNPVTAQSPETPHSVVGNPTQSAEAPTGEGSPSGAEVKKRGRRPKAEAPPESIPEALALYVDCVPSGSATPLAAYLAGLVDGMLRPFPGLLDVRTAPKKAKNAEGKDVDHPYAFGGWKGVLAAEARLNPPKPGKYVALGVAQSEIAQVVVEALEPLCAEFVRGVR